MSVLVEFAEKEKIVGHVSIPSGSLLLVDGAFAADLPLNNKHNLALDLNLEAVRLPIIATQQHGRRYLLIPIDAAEAIPEIADTIETTDQVEEIKDEPKKADRSRPTR